MFDASDSEVVQESLLNFKDRYFLSGIGSGSGIAKRFKDPAQTTVRSLKEILQR